MTVSDAPAPWGDEARQRRLIRHHCELWIELSEEMIAERDDLDRCWGYIVYELGQDPGPEFSNVYWTWQSGWGVTDAEVEAQRQLAADEQVQLARKAREEYTKMTTATPADGEPM